MGNSPRRMLWSSRFEMTCLNCHWSYYYNLLMISYIRNWWRLFLRLIFLEIKIGIERPIVGLHSSISGVRNVCFEKSDRYNDVLFWDTFMTVCIYFRRNIGLSWPGATIVARHFKRQHSAVLARIHQVSDVICMWIMLILVYVIFVEREKLWFPIVDTLFDLQKSCRLVITKEEFCSFLREFTKYAFLVNIWDWSKVYVIAL